MGCSLVLSHPDPGLLHDTKPVTIPVWDVVSSHVCWPWPRVLFCKPLVRALPATARSQSLTQAQGWDEKMLWALEGQRGKGCSVIQTQPGQRGGVGHASPEGQGCRRGARQPGCLSGHA